MRAAEPAPTKWTVDGVEREALVYLPSTASKSKPPVILAFHGHGGNMHFAASGMAFQNSWPEAIVGYPQGLPTPGIVMDFEGKKPGWQDQPGQQGNRDLKFVDAILKTLLEKYSIDESRIYTTGFSNGGLFNYLLLSQRTNVFAAFGPGGAVLLPQLSLTASAAGVSSWWSKRSAGEIRKTAGHDRAASQIQRLCRARTIVRQSVYHLRFH